MNNFMNFVNKFLAERGIRDGVGASKVVKALSLPASDLAPASSSCSQMILAKKLTQGFCLVVRDPGAITKEEEKDQGRDSSERSG